MCKVCDVNAGMRLVDAIKPFLMKGVVVGFKNYDDYETLSLIDASGKVFALSANSDESGWFCHDDKLPDDFFTVEEEIVLKNMDGYQEVKTHEKYRLSSKLSIMDISRKLPGVAKQDGDGEKVKHEWRFTYKGEPCSIYDWKRDRWTAHGPAYVWKELGFQHEGII